MAMIVNVEAKCVVRDEPDNKEKWPTLFSSRPAIGDIVGSEAGVELPVTAVKHSSISKLRNDEMWQYPTMTLILG